MIFILEIKNLTKTYKKVNKAVDNINIRVQPGDIYGFIGANGAGKTTTIKCVVGILNFEDGEIFIDGKSIKENPIECKKIMAYIPDETNLYENLKGIEYLDFVASIYNVENNKKNELIEKYANLLEIKDNLSSTISTYSHGMKQKLVIISALIHEPKLLILDEPFVGLDPKSTYILKELMKEMCSKGCSIFFSTHVLEVAQKLCNKVSIIKSGKIVVEGKIEDIVENKSLEDVFMELINE